MIDINDFSKKQIIFFIPSKGDKISYKNDNMVITDGDGKIKYQHTCYRIFMLVVVGDASITTGLIRRADKYGFAICLMSYTFKLYAVLNAGMQGNTYLHKKQYAYCGDEIARNIIKNKVINQRDALSQIRRKSEFVKEGISMLDSYRLKLNEHNIERDTTLGIEGTASKVYFARIFDNVRWKGRKPRIKFDYINSLLDIGYNLLFNFIDCILQVFGFDAYYGVFHTCFYMRKSLVCDIMEHFRPLIDWRLRIGINLQQFKEQDFVQINGHWQLNYKKSSDYTNIFMKDLLECKEAIFLYIRGYYRAFMKELNPDIYPQFSIKDKIVVSQLEDGCTDNY